MLGICRELAGNLSLQRTCKQNANQQTLTTQPCGSRACKNKSRGKHAKTLQRPGKEPSATRNVILSGFTDDLDPMPVSLAKAVVERELLNRGEAFDDMFSEFDDTPLGSASIAQVHRAVLAPKYGGPKEVAVKIQRPSIESKLMGDISNLIALSKPLQDADALPLDYYTVFVELKKQLKDEVCQV